MIKLIAIQLLFITSISHGQIHKKFEFGLKPGIKTMETKYFGKEGDTEGWRNIKHFDQKGRVIAEEIFNNKTLYSTIEHTYNENNDLILTISIDNINKSKNVDTNSVYIYKYNQENEIIFMKHIIGSNLYISTYRLLENKLPKCIKYVRISENNLKKYEKTKINIQYIQLYYNIDSLIEKEIITSDSFIDRKLVHTTQYHNNGQIKCLMTTRMPIAMDTIAHDDLLIKDEFLCYDYEYDQKGRVKIRYNIIEGIITEYETYQYDER